ncbi:MAG: phage portal protein [Enterococcus cecorum]|nr:phage portal protein [Enterococcus cecorum]
MGIFDWLFGNREAQIASSFEEILAFEEQVNALYMKQLALDVNAEFLARAFSQSTFKIRTNNRSDPTSYQKSIEYLLNTRPNSDQASPEFWHSVIYRLITKNEALIIKTDDDQLLIADSWYRKEYAVYADTFSNVVVKDYEYKRTFNADEVIYLKYANTSLSHYINGMYKDFNDLYNRMYEAAKRNNQIRGILKTVGGNLYQDEAALDVLQTYINKLFKSFSTNDVSVVNVPNKLEYSEMTNKVGNSTQSVEELKAWKRQYIDDVSDLLGIPTKLLHGDIGELEQAQEIFNAYCLGPLVKKVEGELNAKFLTESEIKSGIAINVIGINRRDLFDLAEAIDKLIASGAFNRNEIRKELDYDAIENGDEYYITKNYEKEVRADENQT